MIQLWRGTPTYCCYIHVVVLLCLLYRQGVGCYFEKSYFRDEVVVVPVNNISCAISRIYSVDYISPCLIIINNVSPTLTSNFYFHRTLVR